MILYFAGDGVTVPIRPEEVFEDQENVGILLAFYKINQAKSTRSYKRFKNIRKNRTVKKGKI